MFWFLEQIPEHRWANTIFHSPFSQIPMVQLRSASKWQMPLHGSHLALTLPNRHFIDVEPCLPQLKSWKLFIPPFIWLSSLLYIWVSQIPEVMDKMYSVFLIYLVFPWDSMLEKYKVIFVSHFSVFGKQVFKYIKNLKGAEDLETRRLRLIPSIVFLGYSWELHNSLSLSLLLFPSTLFIFPRIFCR